MGSKITGRSVAARYKEIRVPKYTYRMHAPHPVPDKFTLDVQLVIELPNGDLRQCSTRAVLFEFSARRMRWENIQEFHWNCTLDCVAVALDFSHSALEPKPIFRQMIDRPLVAGSVVTFDAYRLTVDEDVFVNIKVPREDFVIDEEPDTIDWQQQLATSLAPKKKRFTRRRKIT